MRFIIAFFALVWSTSFALADVKVVASIKPIHSLVASVMAGAGEPRLIVSGSASPHTYALKPSDAQVLQDAQIVFWVGPELEAFLQKPLEALAENATQVALLHVHGVQTLPTRTSARFDVDADGEMTPGSIDGHIWLDPENAKVMLKIIADTLSKLDAQNAGTYQANAAKASSSINSLIGDISETIKPVNGKHFIVFHDAYHYFESRFGLKAAGAISINPENPPGAKAIAALRQRVADNNVQCVFAEPQFDNAIVNVIIEGSPVKSAVLDPEGTSLDPGPQLYEQLLRNLTQSLVHCLR
jgi:zinc transport system substrate-binding protein